jgi:hypothetical protein
MRKTFIFVALVAALAAGRPVWSLLDSIWGDSCASRPAGCIVTPQTDAGLGMDPDGKPGS